jgi:very-short-patch-repair endonuclease
MATRTLAENVFPFLDRAAKLVGRNAEESFSQFAFTIATRELESPIEDLFFIACAALCEAMHEPLNIARVTPQSPRGIYIQPQAQVGMYRVDFLLQQVGLAPEEIYTPVIVELDGHDFHDKDKRQRSYEKARDRELVRQRFKVLHFTGSDVVKDPFAPAFEALEMVAVTLGWWGEYNPADPMGLGD